MQSIRTSLRTSSRRLPVKSTKTIRPTRPIFLQNHLRTMSLYPRFTNDFGALFRMLDDYASQANHGEFSSSSAVRTFSPKFDVKEAKDFYELYGELPGVSQDQISIEFTQPQTIHISGRIENRHSASSNDGEQAKESGYHKPTIEDVPEGNEDGKKGQQSETSIQRTDQGRDVVHRRGESGSRWWVTERAVGEFSRTFSFPTRVDQDNVSANLKDGILKVHVPKAKKQESRRITIQS